MQHTAHPTNCYLAHHARLIQCTTHPTNCYLAHHARLIPCTTHPTGPCLFYHALLIPLCAVLPICTAHTALHCSSHNVLHSYHALPPMSYSSSLALLIPSHTAGPLAHYASATWRIPGLHRHAPPTSEGAVTPIASVCSPIHTSHFSDTQTNN